jgi:hypothetical protein
MALNDDLDSDALARAGYCRLSPQNFALFESIERRIAAGIEVPWCEYESILLAVFSSAYGDHHRALALTA